MHHLLLTLHSLELHRHCLWLKLKEKNMTLKNKMTLNLIYFINYCKYEMERAILL